MTFSHSTTTCDILLLYLRKSSLPGMSWNPEAVMVVVGFLALAKTPYVT